MLEALWTVEFVSSAEIVGTGVVVLETDRIFGGDASYYYLGSYKVDGRFLTAELEVTHFAGPSLSVFGPAERFNLRLSGAIESPEMELRGSVVENADRRIVMRLHRRAELP